LSGETSVTLFKRRAKALVERGAKEISTVIDEEKHIPGWRDLTEKMHSESEASSADVAVPMMSDIFTWRHLEYDVRMGKGEARRLLEDVSGYVAPGKLTALMGESGAGKVSREFRRYKLTLNVFPQTTLLNVLAERQAAGAVSGERLVNGYPLPNDFQAQT
jgi:ATP-binding cassette subfamily G (WHITE) protein 2 (SNQ2)